MKKFILFAVSMLMAAVFPHEVRSQGLLQMVSTNMVGVTLTDPGQYSSVTTLNPGSLFDQITQVRVNLVLSSPDPVQPMWLGQIQAMLLYGIPDEVQRSAIVLDRLGVSGTDPFGNNATSLNQTFDLGGAFNGGLLGSHRWTLTVADMQSGAVTRFDSWTLEVSGVPEPSSASLVTLGLAAVLAKRRRCRR